MADEVLSIKRSTLTGIGDAVRAQTGKSAEISVLALEAEIRSIGTGVDTSDATITPETVFENEIGYGKAGRVVGTFTITPELATQGSLLSQVKAALKGKAAGGGSTTPEYMSLYQRVEYITSDGESYFITDFIADNTCGIEMVISFPSFADHTWSGSRTDSGNTRFFAPYAYSASIWYAGFNTNVKISASTQIETIYRCQANFLDSRLATVYDEAGTLKGSASISDTLTAHTYPICIFTQNYAGIPRTPRVFNLYSARCSKGHEVVREYIPCYRKADGVIGAYEKFTDTFITAAEGAFIAGTNIDW